MVRFIFLITLFTTIVFSNSFIVYEKQVADDFSQYYAKVKNFEKDIKLLIGTGTPEVLELQNLSKDIKLLHCFGGDMGTSAMVGYYYTYILNLRTQKIVGIFEYHDNYFKDIKPTLKLNKNSVSVEYFDNDTQSVKVKEYFLYTY